LLIRLTATGGHPLFVLPELQPYIGGAEANVALGLQRLGNPARMVSVVPDNDLGLAALQELRRWGVDVSGIETGPGRMGLYFLTPGAIQRPSDILYDRSGSAFATAKFSRTSWSRLLKGASWLHVSGVTAALGASSARAALKAMQAARAQGVKVSYDCNFRPKLWDAWGGDAPTTIRHLMAQADLIFGTYRDIELVFGTTFTGAEGALERGLAAARHAFAEFPDLQRIAGTRRTQINADHNQLSGLMFTRGGQETHVFETETYDLPRIIDRIGGGDAFAAGLLHGLLRDDGDQRALDYGIACGCLKHAQPGDISLVTHDELVDFLGDGGFDVRR
jgi:2-dehydro-3-deoxygluconokinase